MEQNYQSGLVEMVAAEPSVTERLIRAAAPVLA